LRRNQKFKEHIKISEEPEEGPFFIFATDHNYFAYKASQFVTSSTLLLNWTELSEKQRSALELTLVPSSIRCLSEADKQEYINDSPTLQMDVWDYDFILIPKQIHDSSHKKLILKQIDKAISNVRDSRWTKPNGRSLGRAKYWDDYLLYEKLLEDGFQYDHILRLVASDEANELRNYNSQKRKNTAQNLVNRFGKYSKPKRISDVQKRIEEINHCFESVYPEFQPFEVKR